MYLDFYGLKEYPFNVTSDPSFLYLSEQHREALASLQYGIEARKGFLEITGEIGAGKTTVCKALLGKLDGSCRTAFILHSDLSELQLIESILEDFGLTPPRRSKIAMIRELNRFLLEELQHRTNVVLILDEAQTLKVKTLETIRLLSNLETDKEKLMQIVLVGQPELRKKLASPKLTQLRQRISVRYHINPLPVDEVGKYIHHRLRVAGSRTGIEFEPGCYERIYHYSAGVPRLINLVCDRALLAGFSQGREVVGCDLIEQSMKEVEGQGR
jgi:general secretion pathway protein A